MELWWNPKQKHSLHIDVLIVKSLEYPFTIVYKPDKIEMNWNAGVYSKFISQILNPYIPICTL